MSDYLAHLAEWKNSKSKIFGVEGYTASVSDVFETAKSSRCVDIESPKFFARATVWESGELDVEAIDKKTGVDIVRRTFQVEAEWDLDDKLNWWLSEIVVY